MQCREGDWLGAALAYVSLMPAFHVFFRGALLYHERSWDQLEGFLGVGGNAGAHLPASAAAERRLHNMPGTLPHQL
jgi:hypothetical protein